MRSGPKDCCLVLNDNFQDASGLKRKTDHLFPACQTTPSIFKQDKEQGRPPPGVYAQVNEDGGRRSDAVLIEKRQVEDGGRRSDAVLLEKRQVEDGGRRRDAVLLEKRQVPD